MAAIDVSVRLRGGIFTKDIPRVVQKQIVYEALDKIATRTERQGRKLGARRNTITQRRPRPLELETSSTLKSPRTSGRSWQSKNIGAVKGMAPRVMNKTAARIAEEMGM